MIWRYTDKRHSALPFFSYPKHYPTYPSRAQFTDYLENYARHFNLRPRFGQKVLSIERADEGWHTQPRTPTMSHRSWSSLPGTTENRMCRPSRNKSAFRAQFSTVLSTKTGARLRGKRSSW